MKRILLALAVLSTAVTAHEWTPTYPKLQHSFVEGIQVVRMHLYNFRQDVEYYQVEAFDEEWNKLKFVTSEHIIPIGYLEQKDVDMYFQQEESDKVVYICSRSRTKKTSETKTIVSSKICSKVRQQFEE